MQRLLRLPLFVMLVGCGGRTAGVSSVGPVGSVPPSKAPSASVASTPVPTAMPTAQASEPALMPIDIPPPALNFVADASPAPLFSYPIGAPGERPAMAFFATAFKLRTLGITRTTGTPARIGTPSAMARPLALRSTQLPPVEVVYAGLNYPGRVVIIRHAGDLFSMYGHLDPALNVARGQQVIRGELLGLVLQRGDDVPDHLHFEIRAFLTSDEVNGAMPHYNFRCGPNCPPGPSYWPIDAPDLPSTAGWYNPTHVINRRAFPSDAQPPIVQVVVATSPISASLTLWEYPPGQGLPCSLGEIALRSGERFALLEVRAAPEATTLTSAGSYSGTALICRTSAVVGLRPRWLRRSRLAATGGRRPSHSIYSQLSPTVHSVSRALKLQ